MGTLSIWHWLALFGFFWCSIPCALLAHFKGRSVIGFFIYGFLPLIGYIGLLHALVMKNENKTKAEN
jgi:hypothetical protein